MRCWLWGDALDGEGQVGINTKIERLVVATLSVRGLHTRNQSSVLV